MKKSKYILLVCLLFSCTQNNKIVISDANSVLIDSIILNDVNIDAELSYGQNKLGHLTISHYNPKRDNIYTYDIYNKLTNSININPDKTGRYFYISSDTTLYVLNGRGNYITILKKGVYTHANAAQNDSLPATYYSSLMPFQVINNRVLLRKTLQHDIRSQSGNVALFKSKMLRLYDIQNDSLIEKVSTGAFPEEYVSNFHYEFSPRGAYSTKFQKIYYIFNNNNAIYEYTIKTKMLQVYTIDGLQKNNQKSFGENNADLSYAQKYLLENSQYYMMLYDNLLDKFVVVQKIGIPAINAKGELSLFTDQPYQIYFINKNYVVEKIFRFENNRNHKFPFAYCHNGLLYVPARDVRRNNGKNELTIYVYKIS